MKIQTLLGKDLDDLIIEGINHILKNGVFLKTRVDDAQQAYYVNYVLLNSRKRLHLLRAPTSINYLAREFIAYFNGKLDIYHGLLKGSSYWKKVADEEGRITSNYGYYVFYEKNDNMTQYEWVVQSLIEDPMTRRAVININQCYHKKFETKDFPCTISMNFFIKENELHCVVFSRSTDIILWIAL